MKRFVIGLILFLLSIQSMAQMPTPQDRVDKFLNEFFIRIEEGSATSQDLAICQTFLQMPFSDPYKMKILLRTAQYQRKIAQDPQLSIKLLLPCLRDDFSEKSVPAIEECTINQDNVLCAIEIANCLMEEGKYKSALNIIDSIGQKFTDEARVLAAETAGDIYEKMQMKQKAVEIYTFGLQTLNTLKKTGYRADRGEYTFFSEEQKIIKNRISSKLQKTKKSLETELFGPDWAAYRDAREKHFSEKFLSAYILYEKIIKDFSDSIYAEAARCYRIEILLKFADPSEISNLSKIIHSQQQKLLDLRKKLQRANSSRNQNAIKKYQSKINELKEFLDYAATIPTGIKALELAEKEAEKFLSENETGLYRGEVLLNIAMCHLTVFFEPKKGEKWLMRTQNWLNNIKALTDSLENFQIPAASSEISKPVQKTFYRDEWGNLLDTKIKPGDLVNRQTCCWYLNQLTAETERFLGFLDFVRADMPAAMAHFEIMKEEDQKVIEALEQHEPNMYDRLVYYCENGIFRSAQKEDLKIFKGRHLFNIMLADFYATVEMFEKAWKLTDRFLKGEFGPYDKSQEAYLRFANAWSLWADGVYRDRPEYEEQSIKVLQKFLTDTKLQKQPIAPRALLSLSNEYHYHERKQDAINVCKFVEKNYKQTPYCEQAWHSHGCLLLYSISDTPPDPADIPEGLRCMKKVLTFPNGRCHKMALQTIKEFEKKDEN